ncbi:MAG: ankyrin repeat domain-containing protein [Patescibacteria group bacterium]
MNNTDKDLFNSTKNGSSADILKLLKAGADINTRDEHGNTPIFYAVTPFGGDLNLVKFFVEHGADVNVKNKVGENLLAYGSKYVSSALENNMLSSIGDYLRTHGYKY